jgi:acyl carrier protein
MSDPAAQESIHPRLIQCFAAVFPSLTPAEIPRASVASLGSWDSVTHATLTAVVEEEFEFAFEAEEIETLTSFALFEAAVQDHLRA